MTSPAPRRMWIDGEWVEAVSGATLEVRDPATDEVIAQVPAADARDVQRAVAAARRAFDRGGGTRRRRSAVACSSARGGDPVRAAALAELETLDMRQADRRSRRFDIADVATCFEYYGGLATKIHGEVSRCPTTRCRWP